MLSSDWLPTLFLRAGRSVIRWETYLRDLHCAVKKTRYAISDVSARLVVRALPGLRVWRSPRTLTSMGVCCTCDIPRCPDGEETKRMRMTWHYWIILQKLEGRDHEDEMFRFLREGDIFMRNRWTWKGQWNENSGHVLVSKLHLHFSTSNSIRTRWSLHSRSQYRPLIKWIRSEIIQERATTSYNDVQCRHCFKKVQHVSSSSKIRELERMSAESWYIQLVMLKGFLQAHRPVSIHAHI
jgi:hypothetical protein